MQYTCTTFKNKHTKSIHTIVTLEWEEKNMTKFLLVYRYLLSFATIFCYALYLITILTLLFSVNFVFHQIFFLSKNLQIFLSFFLFILLQLTLLCKFFSFVLFLPFNIPVEFVSNDLPSTPILKINQQVLEVYQQQLQLNLQFSYIASSYCPQQKPCCAHLQQSQYLS